jgi:hypothetical protein
MLETRDKRMDRYLFCDHPVNHNDQRLRMLIMDKVGAFDPLNTAVRRQAGNGMNAQNI